VKITGIKTFLVYPGVRKNLVFVKVETDDGIHGWGEAYTQADRDNSVIAHITELTRYVVGRDPFNIKHLSQVAYDDYAARRGALEFWSALSGVEQACWDIVGKALDTPVYRLLGGACRGRIRVYANGWFGHARTPGEFATRAVETVQRGFTALKFDPFPGPWRLHFDRRDEDTAVERVAAVREAVGPDVDILLDIHRRMAPMHAIRAAKMLEPYRPFWYEEPCPAENIDALAEIRRNISIPVVTGEALYTKSAFREVFEKQAVDIINPDVCCAGGILELKEIAAMAEPYYVVVSPHNFNSVALGLAASLQVSACIPNFLILEYFVNMEPVVKDIAVKPFQVENGYIGLPQGPGLGMELHEEALLAHAGRQFPPRAIRQHDEEGP
jgi:galactonate dehydratase